MTAPEVVTIVGAGRIGRALGGIISANRPSADFRYWDNVTANRSPGLTSFAVAVKDATIVLFTVPSTALPILLVEPTVIPSIAILVTMVKGAPDTQTLSPAEYLEQHWPQHAVVAVGGPMMAEEMSADHPGRAVIASRDAAARQRVADLFQHTHLVTTLSDKPIDVSRSGVLKNLYACIIGMIDGLDLSPDDHRHGHALVRTEFDRAGQLLQIDRDVFNGPAGLGDFLATIHSPHSRNRRSGESLVRNQVHDHTAEALHSFPPVLAALGPTADVPLLRAAGAIIAGTQLPMTLHQLIRSL